MSGHPATAHAAGSVVSQIMQLMDSLAPLRRAKSPRIVKAVRPKIERLSPNVTLYLGDAREVLPQLSGVDLVATDPPYSSGGFTRTDRNARSGAKYQSSATIRRHPDFAGDNRDQRSFTLWCSDWLAQCLAATRSGAGLLCFSDWRNLPCVIDAVQVGGWVYRSLLPWDKTEASRPDKGWFRAQVEYVVAATNGPIVRGARSTGIVQRGYFRFPVIGREKHHVTGKPVALMREMIRTRDDWRLVADPFMGSGSTGVAAVELGRAFVGIECDEANFEVARKRIREAIRAGAGS